MSGLQHITHQTARGLLHAVRLNQGQDQDKGQGPRQPLVLLHGNGQSWHEFEHVLPKFARDFDVIAVDMAGQGDSFYRDTALGIDEHAADVRALLGRLAVSGAVVAGNSVGAFIAAALASDAALVSRLVLIEAQFRTRAWWDAAWPMVEQLFAIPTQSREQVQARRETTLTDAELARWNIDRNKAGTWSLLHGMDAIRTHDFAGALAKVSVPTLLLFGARGPAIEAGDGLQQAIGHATRAVVEGAGHFIVADQPDLFVQHIVDFAKQP